MGMLFGFISTLVVLAFVVGNNNLFYAALTIGVIGLIFIIDLLEKLVKKVTILTNIIVSEKIKRGDE